MNTLTYIEKDSSLDQVLAPIDVLRSVFTALNQRNISTAVDQFADDFVFNDFALGLEFKNKNRLREFCQKSHELFPDTAVELVSTFECGDYAIAEWKLTAKRIEELGSRRYEFPIALRGSTIAQIENGRVSHWSDYYDKLKSRRGPLKAFFEEWIEY